MEQAHPTGCVNCLKSELRFERNKKPVSERKPHGERDLHPPPPPPQVTSQSIQYCTSGSIRAQVGWGEG